MARTVLSISMSLDGFIAERSEGVGTSLAAGAVITGRRTFELAGQWNGDHRDAVPVYVLTHVAPDGDRSGAVQYVTDVESVVTRATAAAGHRDVLIRGASTARELLRLGLLDAMEIHLVHLLLGRGRRLFDELEADHGALRLTHTREGRGVTHFHFAVENASPAL